MPALDGFAAQGGEAGDEGWARQRFFSSGRSDCRARQRLGPVNAVRHLWAVEGDQIYPLSMYRNETDAAPASNEQGPELTRIQEISANASDIPEKG